MNKEKWFLHVDLISYDPKGTERESSINLHIAFDSRRDMNQAYVDYHANIGENFTLSDPYTIIAVEPSLYPIITETADNDDPLPGA